MNGPISQKEVGETLLKQWSDLSPNEKGFNTFWRRSKAKQPERKYLLKENLVENQMGALKCQLTFGGSDDIFV